MKVSPHRPTRSCRKHRPAAVQAHRQGDRDEHGGQEQQPQRGHRPVEDLLGPPAHAGELRPLHVQQRQAGDRPDVHPRAHHVGDGGREEQLGVGVLELPAEAAQHRAVDLRSGQHGDGVHLEGGDDVDDVGHPAEHRQAVEGVRAAGLLPRGQAAPDHLVALLRAALELLVEGGDGLPRPDQGRRLEEVAALAGPTQVVPVRRSRDEGEDRGQRQGEDHEAPGDVEAQAPGDRPDQGEHEHGRADDPAVLLHADPEEPLLVGPGHEHDGHPEEGQDERGPDRRARTAGREHVEPQQVAGDRRDGGGQRVERRGAPDVARTPGSPGGGPLAADARSEQLPARARRGCRGHASGPVDTGGGHGLTPR